jgi:formate hydrogenlyase subunit 3/multisubunit Na+/H+ antiporter MnhD subunit
MVAAIIVAGLIAGIVAFIVSNITANINTIVTSCLISVWIAEIIVLVIRNRMTYKKRIKLMDENDIEKAKEEEKKLKKMYIISTAGFSIIFGFIFYNLKEQIINSINGTGEEITKGTANSPAFYLKIIIVVVLIIIYILRAVKQRDNKNKA